MERHRETYTLWDRIIFVLLMLAVIILLIIGTIQEPPNVVLEDENLNLEVDLVEESRDVENFLDYTCAELKSEFGKADTPYERDILITNIMNLKDCDVKIRCISDDKFEFYLEQFERGVVSEEEFKGINEEYFTCSQ